MIKLHTLQNEMEQCKKCLQAGFQITPGAVFSGGLTAEVMVIGQAPGITEAEVKRPFNAGSGRRLFQWLEAAGWGEQSFRTKHYMTAVTKCFPGKNGTGRGDRVPSKIEQELCRSYLEQEIELVKPKLIIPVGRLAIDLFFPSKDKLNETIGRGLYYSQEVKWENPLHPVSEPYVANVLAIDLPSVGFWIVPLPHPSGASSWPNNPKNQKLIDRAVRLLYMIREQWEL